MVSKTVLDSNFRLWRDKQKNESLPAVDERKKQQKYRRDMER